MSPEESERLDILDWLKGTFDLDVTAEEIEIFGISSNILQKIDKLVEVSEAYLMENSETRQKLSEVREYFSQFPRTVLETTSDVSDEVARKTGSPRYNWIPAPKLGEER